MDSYCQHLGPGLWAEPLNVLTNLACLLAAALVWPRVCRAAWPELPALTLLLAAIGIRSPLWHLPKAVTAGWRTVIPQRHSVRRPIAEPLAPGL